MTPLNIAVLLKQIPDLEGESDILRWDCAPQDHSALELVVGLKKSREVRITAISMGPERVVELLRWACSMGADHMVHIHEDPYDSFNPDRTARVLAEWIKKSGGYDLIFSGVQSPDSGSGLLAPLIAARLGIPLLSYARFVVLGESGTVSVRREVDEGTAMVEAPLPAMVSIAGPLPSRREYLSRVCSAEDPERVESIEIAPLARKGKERAYEEYRGTTEVKLAEGEVLPQQVSELLRLLREETRVI